MTDPSSSNSGNGHDKRTGPRISPESLKPQLPKRFYKEAGIAPAEGGYAVTLDGRPVRTPAKAPLVVVTEALAQALAGEWAAQRTHVDPATMPLTRLANTTIDAVSKSAPEVAADIVAFAGTDALLYGAESPAELVERQHASWDPVIAWAAKALGAHLIPAAGIRHVAQPAEALDAIALSLEPHDPWRLAPIHVMTTLTGSALLALSVSKGALDARQAWSAAHIDEDWQIERWGEDAEARARREFRWAEMNAAARFLELAGQS